MPPLLSEVSAPPTLLDLNMMGFDLVRLQFYRWLVEHDRNPEFLDQPGDVRRQGPPGVTVHVAA